MSRKRTIPIRVSEEFFLDLKFIQKKKGIPIVEITRRLHPIIINNADDFMIKKRRVRK